MNSLTSKSISFEKKGLRVRTLEWTLTYSFALVNSTGAGIWCKTAVFTSEKCEKKSTWNSLNLHCILSLDKTKRVTCLFCRVLFTRKENKSIGYQVSQTEQHIVDHFSRSDVRLTVSQTDQFSAFSELIYNFSLTPNLRTDTWTLLFTNVESVTFLSVVFTLFLSSQLTCLNINNIES